jgi:hypothetical protein
MDAGERELMGAAMEDRRRVLVARGRIPARRAGGCTPARHTGPLLRREVYEAAGPMWEGVGDCAACGSTVHYAHLQSHAA